MLDQRHADVLFTGGRIWPGTDWRGALDTLAVRGTQVVGMGSMADMRRTRGPGTRVIPLYGRLLLPAFGDAHVHPLLAGLGMSRCWLSDEPEEPEAYLSVIRAYAEAHRDLPWLTGEGWVLSAFPGGLAPAHLLDTIEPDRPVFLESADGHAAWVNSVALGMAGIGPDTPDPEHGRIERYPDGSPLGTLQESAMDLVKAQVPPATALEREDGLRRGQAALHRVGVGTWQDADVDSDLQAAYLAVAGRGELTGRAALALRWATDRGTEQVSDLVARRLVVDRDGGGRVTAPSVKIFQDLSVENRTAAMLEPYLGVDGTPGDDRGGSQFGPAALRDLCVAVDGAGFAVHAHAIGDRAAREVLDGIEAARRSNGSGGGRHQITHLQFVGEADIPRFRALDVIASCQPYWAAHGGYVDDLTEPIVGTERIWRMYPLGSLARTGATLAFGSDWSVSTPDPMRVMEVAVRRVERAARATRPLGPPAERLDLDTALRAYTRGSALANGSEAGSGVIEVGRPADLVLLDQDPFQVEDTRIGDVHVLLTMVDGRVVWEDPALGA